MLMRKRERQRNAQNETEDRLVGPRGSTPWRCAVCFWGVDSQLIFAVLLDPEGPFGLEGFLFHSTKGLTFSKPAKDWKERKDN